MDRLHYKEMIDNLNELLKSGETESKIIYLFGHCNATEELADALLERGYIPAAILDNNKAKHGKDYKGIGIVPPSEIMDEKTEDCLVCIVARAYAAMADQLKRSGYKGMIRKLVDYNSYADYSLSESTLLRMEMRVLHGEKKLEELNCRLERNCGGSSGYRKILCPFSALGDIYFMMSYLPYYLEKTGAENCFIGVVGDACAEVVKLFGSYPVAAFSQKDMDEMIQAALYTRDQQTFIPHQDRPYVVDLYKALYVKKIPLERIYCCGVFGLSADTKGYEPGNFAEYPDLQKIRKGRAVILSPYAKSVAALPDDLWKQIVEDYTLKGYQCFTNVSGEEKALAGTLPISPSIAEIRSVVERAGTFVGIRNGLCDVLRTAKADRTALYPDYNYCDTDWKAIDIYRIEGWKNIVITDGFDWKKNQ